MTIEKISINLGLPILEIKNERSVSIVGFESYMGPASNKGDIIELVKAVDREGIDSLWVLDRLLWPLNPQASYRGTRDRTLPASAQNVFDPIELLTFAAANTEKTALGTSDIDMLFHNPVILARRFATLDVLSQGRVICGLGIGWSKDEYH
jgi:alkanesulfonate monooxygenase SsuD/methylene tetrahydromethanopterin reductase-like flavin-dependent oxidoreductase (luciferase family)